MNCEDLIYKIFSDSQITLRNMAMNAMVVKLDNKVTRTAVDTSTVERAMTRLAKVLNVYYYLTEKKFCRMILKGINSILLLKQQRNRSQILEWYGNPQNCDLWNNDQSISYMLFDEFKMLFEGHELEQSKGTTLEFYDLLANRMDQLSEIFDPEKAAQYRASESLRLIFTTLQSVREKQLKHQSPDRKTFLSEDAFDYRLTHYIEKPSGAQNRVDLMQLLKDNQAIKPLLLEFPRKFQANMFLSGMMFQYIPDFCANVLDTRKGGSITTEQLVRNVERLFDNQPNSFPITQKTVTENFPFLKRESLTDVPLVNIELWIKEFEDLMSQRKAEEGEEDLPSYSEQYGQFGSTSGMYDQPPGVQPGALPKDIAKDVKIIKVDNSWVIYAGIVGLFLMYNSFS